MELKDSIRNISDFPEKGIVFRDITTLLQNSNHLKASINNLYELFAEKKIDIIAAPESRGFMFGVTLAYKMNAGFVPVRKPGKLPYETVSISYDLEYGKDTLEMHKDAVKKGQNVLIVDDLLATGGTVKATAELIEKLGGNIVGIGFLIELLELGGMKKLEKYDVKSVIKF